MPALAAVLGVDVGGTKVALRLRTAAGEERSGGFAWPAPGPTAVLDHELVARQVRAFVAGAPRIAAAGVALPATLDAAGTVVAWPNRSSWVGCDPLAPLRAALPGTVLGHGGDGDLGALAEATAAGATDLVYVGIGTGVGGGIVLDGRVCPGPLRGSCEIGHMIVDRSGPECTCGRRGCLQAMAAGPATRRRAAGLRGTPVAPDELPAAVAAGQEWAVTAVDEGAAAVAAAVAGVRELLGVDTAVVGGGFADAMPGYVERVAAHTSALGRHGHPAPAVRAAALGGLSSLVGALHLAGSLVG